MIYGIGTDILFVPRIADALQRFGARFSNRILASAEQQQLANLSSDNRAALFVAKRFAAKEAYAKALGTGVGNGFTWHDIEVRNDENGKPRCVAAAKFAAKLKNLGVVASHVSISDERDYVLAFVTLESA